MYELQPSFKISRLVN